MFSYKTCQPVPVLGGRGVLRDGGGIVEVKGRAVWGGVDGGVYVLDEVNLTWKRMAHGVRRGATLAVCGGELVYVGGCRKKVMVWRGGRWTSMTDMLKGYRQSCVLSTGGGGLVVMGSHVSRGVMLRDDVQVFDGETWHFGPRHPQDFYRASAMVYGDQVFVMGGNGMKQAVWSCNITDLVSH